jgi:hypothetical protein
LDTGEHKLPLECQIWVLAPQIYSWPPGKLWAHPELFSYVNMPSLSSIWRRHTTPTGDIL